MSTARMVTAFVSRIPKKDLFISGGSGFIFGGIAGAMATDKKTENRCEIIFNSACKGLITGAAIGLGSGKLLSEFAKYQNKGPHSDKFKMFTEAYSAKVGAFVVGHNHAKKAKLKQEEERIDSENIAAPKARKP